MSSSLAVLLRLALLGSFAMFAIAGYFLPVRRGIAVTSRGEGEGLAGGAG